MTIEQYAEKESPEALLEFMMESKGEDDWNTRADQIKKHHGNYPDFWYSTLIASRKLHELKAQW